MRPSSLPDGFAIDYVNLSPRGTLSSTEGSTFRRILRFVLFSMKFHAVATTIPVTRVSLSIARALAPWPDSPLAQEDLRGDAAPRCAVPSCQLHFLLPRSLPARKLLRRSLRLLQNFLCRQPDVPERGNVRTGQIVDVDVVANAGSIGRWVVRAENLQFRALPAAASRAKGIRWVSGSCSSPISPLRPRRPH